MGIAMEGLQIVKMSELDEGLRKQVTCLFTEGFSRELAQLSKDTDKLARVFEGAFAQDRCFLAVVGKKVAGMVCYGDDSARALHITKNRLTELFGFIPGSVAFSVLKKEFQTPLSYGAGTGYIECLVTDVKFRRKGVATALLQHLYRETGYSMYILQAADTNAAALALYEKQGFIEFERRPDPSGKKLGFQARVFMLKKIGARPPKP